MARGATWRVVARAGLIPVGVAIGAAVFLDLRLQGQITADARQRLEAETQGYTRLLGTSPLPSVPLALQFRADPTPPGASVFALGDQASGLLAGSVPWPDSLPRSATAPKRITVQKVPYLAQVTDLDGYPLMAGVSLVQAEQSLKRMRNAFALAAIAMAAAGLSAAYFAARSTRQRVAEINHKLDRIGRGGGLHQRLDPPRDDAVHAALVAHINDMLDRIAHLFEAHQRLGNAVAHEMRTPLARIQTRLSALDLAAADRAGLEDEIRATIRLFDSLLSIARMDAEAGDTTGLATMDLSATAAQIAELYSPAAEEGGRRIEALIAPGQTILGDAQLIAQQVSNLLENGLKYTPPGATIRLSVERVGDHVRLSVRDDGPGIDADLRARLFQPFARGTAQAAQPGHGLGLSLVRAIALRHGARLRVPDTEKGFAIEIDYLHFSNHSNS